MTLSTIIYLKEKKVKIILIKQIKINYRIDHLIEI